MSHDDQQLIKIPLNYGYVCLVSVLMALQVYIMIYLVAFKRLRTFNKQFMEQFVPEHEKTFGPGRRPDFLGNPDCGNGYYSRQLSYKEWFEFNSLSRTHLNQVESTAFIIIWTLIAGLIYPQTTSIIGVVHIIGRVLYVIGYLIFPTARLPGWYITFFSGLTLVGYAIAASLSMIQMQDNNNSTPNQGFVLSLK